MASDVSERLSAGILTALDRWTPNYPHSPELDVFTARWDADAGFKQYLQKRVVLTKRFRQRRDLVAYRVLKALLFPRGANFHDPLEYHPYDPRTGLRISKHAREIGILTPVARAKRDGRRKVWKSPFNPDAQALAELQEGRTEFERVNQTHSPISRLNTTLTLLYGPLPLHQVLEKHTDNHFAYAILTGFARGLQQEFAEDWRHARAQFRRWLTNLEKRPGLDQEAWDEFDRVAKLEGVSNLLVHKVTLMLLIDWFAKLPREEQRETLREPAELHVTPGEATEAIGIHGREPDPDPMMFLHVTQGIIALDLLGQTEAALAAAEAAATLPNATDGQRAFAYLRCGQVARFGGHETDAPNLFLRARDAFRASGGTLYEAAAELWYSEIAPNSQERDAAQQRAEILSAKLGDIELCAYHFHAATIAGMRRLRAAEIHHLRELLRMDLLAYDDFEIYEKAQNRLSYLQD